MRLHDIQTNMTEMFTLITNRQTKRNRIIDRLEINKISMFFSADLSYSKNLFASVNCIFSPD